MLVCFFVTAIPDRGGAFYSDLCLAREFRRRGHSVVLIRTCGGMFGHGDHEGFPWKTMHSAGRELDASHLWLGAFYPHGNTIRKLNRTYRRPLVFTLHFEGSASKFNAPPSGYVTWPEKLWYVNSRIPRPLAMPMWVVEHSLQRPFIEKDPVLLPETPAGGYITLINANMNKGLPFFLKLAAAMPERTFLGVRSYYHPPTDPTLHVPRNIEWVDFTRDMKSLLERTRILVVPSAYESFGIVAAEALVNGIPVLYSQPVEHDGDMAHYEGSTWGVQEWIDPAGIACERGNVEAWADAIRTLDDPEVYRERSELSRRHAEPFFGTAAVAANEALAFAQSNPVRINTVTTVRNDPPPQAPGRQAPTLLLKRPNQPVSWQNGKLTFGRR